MKLTCDVHDFSDDALLLLEVLLLVLQELLVQFAQQRVAEPNSRLVRVEDGVLLVVAQILFVLQTTGAFSTVPWLSTCLRCRVSSFHSSLSRLRYKPLTFLVTLKKYPSCALDSSFSTFFGSIPRSLAAFGRVCSISASISSRLLRSAGVQNSTSVEF